LTSTTGRQDPVQHWLSGKTEAKKVEAVPTLKRLESKLQVVSETASNVWAVLALEM